jgi:hypothetical protein
MSSKSDLWFVRERGYNEAKGPFRLDKPVTERTARKHIKKLLGRPVGEVFDAEVWPTSEAELEDLGRLRESLRRESRILFSLADYDFDPYLVADRMFAMRGPAEARRLTKKWGHLIPHEAEGLNLREALEQQGLDALLEVFEDLIIELSSAPLNGYDLGVGKGFEADFGFWPKVAEVFQLVEDGEVVEVTSLEDAPESDIDAEFRGVLVRDENDMVSYYRYLRWGDLQKVYGPVGPIRRSFHPSIYDFEWFDPIRHLRVQLA